MNKAIILHSREDCNQAAKPARGYDGVCRSVACMDQALVKSRRRIPGWLVPSLGYTLSALSLVWVFHGYNLQQTLADLESLDWRYVAIAVIFELAVYLSHAWRWNILLRPVARVPFWRSVQAIF